MEDGFVPRDSLLGAPIEVKKGVLHQIIDIYSKLSAIYEGHYSSNNHPSFSQPFALRLFWDTSQPHRALFSQIETTTVIWKMEALFANHLLDIEVSCSGYLIFGIRPLSVNTHENSGKKFWIFFLTWQVLLIHTEISTYMQTLQVSYVRIISNNSHATSKIYEVNMCRWIRYKRKSGPN